MADSKISALTGYTTPLDADVLPVVDTANTLTKKVTWANVKATLKTYFDTLYPSGSGTSTGTNTGDNATNTQYSGLAASKADLAGSTSQAFSVSTLDVGNTDTTISRSAAGTIAVEGVRIKTTTPLVVSAASYTTDTGTSLNMDNLDQFVITAQASALLFNSPGGTLVQGRSLIIRIKDNGTARALTWNSVFRAMGTSLPSTTVLSKTLYLGFFYNSTDTKWDLVASAQEA